MVDVKNDPVEVKDEKPVPESTLKKKARDEKIAKHRELKSKELTIKRASNKKEYFKRAETFAKEYLQTEKSYKELKKKCVEENKFYVEGEPKLILIVRIKGINRMAPKSRKILHLLRLRQIQNATFVKVSKATLNMIRLIEPYVAYGYPTLETVRELLYKRGYAKVKNQRVAITDNEIIEKALAKYDVICIEDMVHEIFTVGKNFKQVNSFLWPFKLNSPRGGYNKKNCHYIENGDYGNRGEDINSFVHRMN